MSSFKANIAKKFIYIGVSANTLTWLGLLLSAVSAFLIYAGNFFWAANILMLSGALDMLDGEVARQSGSAKRKFGGILDSSLDRYADALIISGALFYCVRIGAFTMAFLCMSALIGSFAISYVRARAECAIERCRVGFWERGERICLLAIGLYCRHLPTAIIILAIATHFTFIGRLYFSYLFELKQLGRPLSSWQKMCERILISTPDRASRAYFLKVLFLVLAVVLLRINF